MRMLETEFKVTACCKESYRCEIQTASFLSIWKSYQIERKEAVQENRFRNRMDNIWSNVLSSQLMDYRIKIKLQRNKRI